LRLCRALKLLSCAGSIKFIGEALMIALAMVVLDVLGDRAPELALAERDVRLRHSSLIDRTKGSAWAFAFGAWYGVRTI
jgi:hypothetical protein